MSFIKTVLDVLAYKKDETFSSFLYSTLQFHNDPVNGVDLWDKVIEYPGYYLSKEEPLIIQAVAKDIKTILENDKLTFVDLGPGSTKAVKTKTVPLLTSLEENIENYIPIDNQKHFLDDSIKCVSNNFKNLTIAPMIGDIFKINEIDKLKKIKNKCLVFLSGATIGNIAEQKNIPYNLTNKLKNMSDSVATGSYFLITQDTNQDLVSLKEAYNNIHGKNFVLNIFHLIKRECNLDNFDPTAFNHIVEWNDKNSVVICAAKALIPQNFKIADKNIYIHKNQKIPIIKSYKYNYEDFTKIAKSTGLKFIKTYWDSSKRIAIHLLQNAS